MGRKHILLHASRYRVLRPAGGNWNEKVRLDAIPISAEGAPYTGEEEITITFRIYLDDQSDPESTFTANTMQDPYTNISWATAPNRILPEPSGDTKKFRITATAEGYEPGMVEIALVSAAWVERQGQQHRGFDPLTNPPWVVVVQAGTTPSKATSLQFNANPPADTRVLLPNWGKQGTSWGENSFATFSPKTADAGKTTTDTDIVGKEKGETFALASKNDVESARVRVCVKPVATIRNMTVYCVKQDALSGVITKEKKNEIVAKIKVLWGSQAGLAFLDTLTQNNPPSEVTVQGVPAEPTPTEALEAIAGRPKPGANETYVYVFWTLKGVQGQTQMPDRVIVIRKDASDNMFAHEVGHAEKLVGGAELMPITPTSAIGRKT